jgi:Zn-dependent M28 family amino/carboxypeptidase
MVGTGSEGITIVNGTVYPKAFALLDSINTSNNYLLNVTPRGESCNSDHCPFYQKGVPSVFIYSRGKEYQEYHNIYDLPQNLPFTEYVDIFSLLRDFIKIY